MISFHDRIWDKFINDLFSNSKGDIAEINISESNYSDMVKSLAPTMSL